MAGKGTSTDIHLGRISKDNSESTGVNHHSVTQCLRSPPVPLSPLNCSIVSLDSNSNSGGLARSTTITPTPSDAGGSRSSSIVGAGIGYGYGGKWFRG